MKAKSLILLSVAIGCGLVAMLGVQQLVNRGGSTNTETVQVLFARTDIPPGKPLDDTNTVFKSVPLGSQPEGAVTKPEEFDDRSLSVTAVANEPIMLAKLNQKGVHSRSMSIPAGMRVITVPATLTMTHNGFIMPGDRVDVVVTLQKQTSGGRSISTTKVILQYIEVFAVDNVHEGEIKKGDETEYASKNVSLLVTPDQYNLALHAQRKGQITLALRRKDDEEVVKTKELTDDMLAQSGSIINNNIGDRADDFEPEKNGAAADKVKDFLTEQEKKASEAKVVESPTSTPKWTIKIYSGDKVKVETVDLPVETTAIGKETATPAGQRKDTSKKNPLWKFLIGA